MARKPNPKKSEALEIRVSHEEKTAFMDAVLKRDTTASRVIRDAMHRFVEETRKKNLAMIKKIRYPIAAALALSLGILAWQAVGVTGDIRAYADDLNSRISLRLTNEQDGVRSRRDLATQIRQPLGEPVILLVSESLGHPILVEEIGTNLEDTGFAFRIIAEEAAQRDQITYRVEIHRTSPNGTMSDILASPVLTVERASTARVEIGIVPIGRLEMELTPDPVAD